MARSTDSFFIRADLVTTNGAFTEQTLDLGAYVDALGKSVLKIHNAQVHFQSNTALYAAPSPTTATQNCSVAWQLTTQSQVSTGLEIVAPSNRSVVSAGFYQVGDGGGGTGTISSESAGLNVQHFTDGYLIGVESLYLGGQQSSLTSDTRVSIVLECTVETLTQSAAMALALSQQ